MYKNFKQFVLNHVFLLLLSFPLLFGLSACSEIEFGSHVYKSLEGPENTANAGNFKVGKPYTVMGRTYYPKETYNYSETGIASWYGPGFHGKRTASGETYSQNELTAAHRTLQMPSLVRVTNLANGRSVVVRVNDRGPFSKGRIMDVSEKAARLLDMTGAGTARVRLDLLADESRALAALARSGTTTKGMEIAYNEKGYLPISARGGNNGGANSPTLSDAAYNTAIPPIGNAGEAMMAQEAQNQAVSGHVNNGHFYPNPVVTQEPVVATKLYVQVGAFGQSANAERLAQNLEHIGASHVDPVPYNGRTLYKVRLGPLDTVQEADSVLSKVLASGQSDAIIVVQ